MSSYEIRLTREDDLNGLVDLHIAAFGARDNAPSDIRAFHQRMLANLLDDRRAGAPGPKSVVSTKDGKVVAMAYHDHHPFLLEGERQWGTTATLLAVHPEHRKISCSRRLLDAVVHAGTSYVAADRTNTDGRRAAMAFTPIRTYPQYSLRWFRVVSPGAGALAGLLNRTNRSNPTTVSVMQRASGLVDSALERASLSKLAIEVPASARKLTRRELTASELAEHGDSLLSNFTVRPDYTCAETNKLTWERFRNLRPEGRVDRIGVWNPSGELVGWYMLHLWESGTAECVQLVARPRQFDDVTILMLQHAKDIGAGSVHGSAAPPMIVPLSDAGASFHGRAAGFLVRTENEAIEEAFTTSRALLTGLEGEYPMQLAPRNALSGPLPRKDVRDGAELGQSPVRRWPLAEVAATF